MSIVILVLKEKIMSSLTPLRKILFFFTGWVRLESGWVRMFFAYSSIHPNLRYINVVREFPKIPMEWVKQIDLILSISQERRVYREVTVSTIAEAEQLVKAFEEKGEEGIAQWPGKQYQLKPVDLLHDNNLPEFCCKHYERKAIEQEGGPDAYGVGDGIF